jgi:hypothetical protein
MKPITGITFCCAAATQGGRYRAAEQGNEAPTVHPILMQPQPREN